MYCNTLDTFSHIRLSPLYCISFRYLSLATLSVVKCLTGGMALRASLIGANTPPT